MWVRKYLQRRKQRINLLQMHYPLSNTKLSLSFLFKFCGLQTQDFLCFHTEIGALTSPPWCNRVRICWKDGKCQFSEGYGAPLQEDPHPTRLLSCGVWGRTGKCHRCPEAGAAKHGQRHSESCQATVQSLVSKGCPPPAGKVSDARNQVLRL